MALSVYNALSNTRRDMSPGEVDAFLRQHFDANLSDDYVLRGVEYLVARKFAAEADGVLSIQRAPSGLGRPLFRAQEDRELSY